MKLRDKAGGVLVALLLGVPMVFDGPTAAQEAAGDDPEPRLAHIHEGTCDELIGPDFVFPLTDVEVPEGEAIGPDEVLAAAEPVAISFTTLDVSLDELVEDAHAIDIHRSEQETDTFVTCGEIAGIPGPTGGLAIALRAQGDSGLGGIAFVVPNPANPAQTDVSVLLAEDLTGGAEGEGTPEAEGA